MTKFPSTKAAGLAGVIGGIGLVVKFGLFMASGALLRDLVPR